MVSSLEKHRVKRILMTAKLVKGLQSTPYLLVRGISWTRRRSYYLLIKVPTELSKVQSFVQVRALGGDIPLCSWASHFTLLTVSPSLHPGVKMGTGELNVGCNPSMEWHSIQGEIEIILVASRYRNQDKLRPDEPLDLYADFTFTNMSAGSPTWGITSDCQVQCNIPKIGNFGTLGKLNLCLKCALQ